MVNEEIFGKPIGLFVDNNIDSYRRGGQITIREMIEVYVNNQGFFVLEKDNHEIIGYLDQADLEKIKDLYNKGDLKSKIGETSLPLRKVLIDYNEKVMDVLSKIKNFDQNFFPVIKDGNLIGRVSKRIIKEKVEQLYS